MCPAEVVCPDKYRIILPNGEVLDERVEGFTDHVPSEDKSSLDWLTVLGTSRGFDVQTEGKQQIIFHVTPTKVKSQPAGYEKELHLRAGNILVLRGGTKITPIQE